MKKHPVLTILLIWLTSLVAACTSAPSGHPAVLERADSISASDPRRAIVMLDSLQPSMRQADSATWFYYQLLRIKAQDRAYLPHTSDQEILQIIGYYERHPEGDLLAWAYCYGGRVYRDLNDTPQALVFFQKSLAELEDGRNPNLRQRVLSQLGYLFYYHYLFDESRAIRHEVIANDSLLGNYDRVLTSYTDIARCFIAEEQYDSAASYARYARILVSQHQLEKQRAATELLDAQVAEYRGLHADALVIIEPYLTDTTLADAVPFLAVACRAQMALGRYAQAEVLCQRILNDRHAKTVNCQQAWRNLALICSSRGQHALAEEYQTRALDCTDNLMRNERKEKARLVSDYYRSRQRELEIQRLQLEKETAQHRFHIACFIVIALLLSAAITWLWIKRRRAERLLSQERVLIDFKSSELCQHIYNLYYTQHPIPDEMWEEVEDYLNDNFPRFIPQLRNMSNFSETEWHLSLLSRLGFRNVEIATLLCKHKSAISLAKKRLYEKVNGHEGKAEDWDHTLTDIS